MDFRFGQICATLTRKETNMWLFRIIFRQNVDKTNPKKKSQIYLILCKFGLNLARIFHPCCLRQYLSVQGCQICLSPVSRYRLGRYQSHVVSHESHVVCGGELRYPINISLRGAAVWITWCLSDVTWRESGSHVVFETRTDINVT